MLRMWVQVFFHFVTIHTFDRDRQTDRGTERPWQYCALHYIQSHNNNTIRKMMPQSDDNDNDEREKHT